MKQSKYKLLILLTLGFVLVLSGCSGKKPADKNVGWQDEVVMAKDCGVDGLQCCPNSNPPCLYGLQCCSDPNDSKINYCSNDCACGGENKFCCKDDTKCKDGLACSGNLCVKCGGDNEPCCSGEKCGKDLTCYQGACKQCGLNGNPCCAGGLPCLNEEKRDESRNECLNGLCSACGSDSQPLCQIEPKCNSHHILNSGFCLKCGDYNKPCCQINDVLDYACNPELELTCDLGFCNKK